MAGRVASLNVSAAGAVVLYEAYRQRRRALQSPAATTAKAVSDKTVPEKSVPERSVPAKPRKGLGS
jgi:tRNA C32,U32 (ribose-2'-O)-methylase TrmJ